MLNLDFRVLEPYRRHGVDSKAKAFGRRPFVDPFVRLRSFVSMWPCSYVDMGSSLAMGLCGNLNFVRISIWWSPVNLSVLYVRGWSGEDAGGFREHFRET